MNNQEELLIKLKTDISQLQKDFTKVGDNLEEQGEKGEKAFNGTEKSLNAVKVAGAAAFAAIGVAAAASFASIAMNVLEVEKALGKIQAQTGKNSEEAKKSLEVAREVYKNGWGESLDEVVQNMNILEAALGDVDDKTLESAQILKESFENADINSVARAVKSMTANFPGLEEAEAMDLITRTMQETGDVSGDVLDTFNEYSVHFAKMGIDAKEFSNILVKGSQAGAFTIDKVGDAVKELGIRAIDGSKLTSEGFDAIGLDAEEMGAKIVSGGQEAENAFMAIIASLSQMEDPLKQNEAGVALFGTQWEDLREDVITSMADGVDAIGEFEGSTKKAGDALSNNMGTKFTTLKRTLIDEFSNSDNPIGEFINDILDKTLTALPQIISNISSFMAFLGEMFSYLNENVFAPITQLLNENKEGISTYFSDIIEILTMTFSTIGEIFASVIEIYQTMWSKYGEDFQKIWGGLWTIIQNVVKGVLDIVAGLFKTFSSLLKGDWEGLSEGLSQIWNGLWTGIKGIFLGAFNILTGYLSYLNNLFTNIFTGLKNAAISIFSTMWNNLKSSFSENISIVSSFISSFIDNLVSTISTAPSRISSVGSDIVQGIWQGIQNFGGWISRKVRSFISDSITGPIKRALKIASPSGVFRDEVGQMIGEGLIDGILGTGDKVAKSSKEIGDKAIEGMEEKTGIMQNLFHALGGNVEGNVSIGFSQDNFKNALNSASVSANLSMASSMKKEQQIELILKGGIDKFADHIEAKIVDKYFSSIGGGGLR